jgi:hypothetical protein
VVASVSVPLVALSVTRTGLAPASTSEIEIRLPLPEEKTRAVSSLVACGPGTALTGASLTGLTLIATELVALSGPPAPVLPWSLVVIESEAAPL